eukprot:8451084-Ditylum_brightwellii.AAC.1
MGQDRRVLRRVASLINYLGVQDTIRKHKSPMLRPGAWTGAMLVITTNKGVYVTATEAKWN